MSAKQPSPDRDALVEQLLAAWQTSDTHTRTLLQAIDLESLLLQPRPHARTIGQVFAHLVAVRLRWVETIGDAGLLEEIEPLEAGDEESRDTLEAALATSAEAVASLARTLLEEGGQVSGFSGGVPALLGSLIAHDAHHRGQILGLLSREGKKVSQEVAYAIWEW